MTARNCAFKVKYNPANEPKVKIKYKADKTGFFRVIINTAEATAIIAKNQNKIIFNVILKFISII
ncbi:MAG: hypothetical protein STSR0008_10940 [Ignavibacterium sp.]